MSPITAHIIRNSAGRPSALRLQNHALPPAASMRKNIDKSCFIFVVGISILHFQIIPVRGKFPVNGYFLCHWKHLFLRQSIIRNINDPVFISCQYGFPVQKADNCALFRPGNDIFFCRIFNHFLPFITVAKIGDLSVPDVPRQGKNCNIIVKFKRKSSKLTFLPCFAEFLKNKSELLVFSSMMKYI